MKKGRHHKRRGKMVPWGKAVVEARCEESDCQRRPDDDGTLTGGRNGGGSCLCRKMRRTWEGGQGWVMEEWGSCVVEQGRRDDGREKIVAGTPGCSRWGWRRKNEVARVEE